MVLEHATEAYDSWVWDLNGGQRCWEEEEEERTPSRGLAQRATLAAHQEVLPKSHSEAQLLNFSKHLFVWLEGFFFFHCKKKRTEDQDGLSETVHVCQTLGKIVEFHFSLTILYPPPPA